MIFKSAALCGAAACALALVLGVGTASAGTQCNQTNGKPCPNDASSSSGRAPSNGTRTGQSQAIQPYASRPIQYNSSQPVRAYTSQTVQPYSSHQVQSYSSHPVQPYSSHPVQPYSSTPVQTFSSRPVQGYASQPVQPGGGDMRGGYGRSYQGDGYGRDRGYVDRGGYGRGRSYEERGGYGRGAGAGPFLGRWNTNVNGAVWQGPSDQWGYAVLHSSVGARAGALQINPDHSFIWNSAYCTHNLGWSETGDPEHPIALRCIEDGKPKTWRVELDDRHPGQIYIFDQWGVNYVGRR